MIVTEILFWQCAFSSPWNNCLGSRSQTSPLKGQRPRTHVHRSDKQDNQGKQQTWYEVIRGTAWGVRQTVSRRQTVSACRRIRCIISRRKFREGMSTMKSRQQKRGNSTTPASDEEGRNTRWSKHNNHTKQDGYGGVPWMCERLYVVLCQGVQHLNIGHSHPYIEKASTTQVSTPFVRIPSLYFVCHKYYVKNTCKQCSLNRLKSELGARSQGALAPSCQTPHGHDQSREHFTIFFHFFDLQQPQVDN